MNGRSRLFLASAGSGKTFQLTTHYLQLVCDGVRHDEVLATTFTRKAAGEILARILSRLAAGAASETGARELDEQLQRKVGQRGYLRHLGELTRHIESFRVGTLDAFFVELAQALAAEVGLPPDWRIADEVDAERGRDAAVAAALGAREREEWSVLLRDLERGDLARGVHSQLAAVVRAAYSLFKDSSPQAWDNPELLAVPTPEELDEFTQRVARLVVPLTKSRTPVSNWEKYKAKLVAFSSQPEFRERASDPKLAREGLGLCSSGVAGNVIAGEERYSSHGIDDEWVEAVRFLVRLVAASLTRVLVEHNRAARRIFEAYDEHHAAQVAQRRRVTFDDVARALAGHADEKGADLRLELALRMDASVSHLLLDEFQDTSPVQWAVLRPLVEELVADGTGSRSFLCVGDVKQSIYGWRSAEPQLLAGLAQRLGLAPERLDRSFRSSQVILDSVNTVFAGIGKYIGFAGDQGALKAAQDFASSFGEHRAQRELAGEVRVHATAGGDDEAGKEIACMARAVELVRDVRGQAPAASVAILLRRNKYASYLLARLRGHGIPASGEGGNPLTDSISVQAALALLHWLEHPGDTVALRHAATSALAETAGLSETLGAAEASRAHRRNSRRLADLGLAAWLAEFRAAVAARHGAWEQRRFGALVEFALGADRQETLGNFLRRVRSERVEDASSARVKVMTIHASKGLEFDAVILPELDRLWSDDSDTFEWRRVDGDPQREIEFVSRSSSREARAVLAYSGVELPGELHEAARARAMRDELSALYVAMTRARHRLDLVLSPVLNKKNEVNCSAAGVLRSAFGLDFAELAPASVVHEVEGSSSDWTLARQKLPDAPPVTHARANFELAPAQRPRELERASPSDLDGEREIGLEKLFQRVGPTPGQRRGTRFHRWLEEIEWLESCAATDERLRELAAELDLGSEGLERDLADFRAALARPGLRQLFTKGPGTLEVWRERRYVRVVGASLQSGSFDRVVVTRENGKAVRAHVIDYKTNKAAGFEGGREALVEHYRPQLEAYRDAVARICGLAPNLVETSLFFVESDELVSL
ncbi:MAG: UvrD-helicase domain-containing protein [Planctomycetota bacterium]|nr:UvrD-helicase domain-containing protein [Planctomycetota bacterium]